MISDEEKIKIGKAYIKNKNETVRSIGIKFGISKTSVHNYLRNDLKYLNYDLYKKVLGKIEFNKNCRAYRSGMAISKIKSTNKKNNGRKV